MSLIKHQRFAVTLIVLHVIAQSIGCDMYITKIEFREYIERQKARDDNQDSTIEDTASKLTCNNHTVQEFLAKCKDTGSVCNATEIGPAVKVMRDDFPHRVLRIPYILGETLSVTESQKAGLVSLFSGRTLPSTKLLIVGISSHETLTTTAGPRTSKNSKRPKVNPPALALRGDVSQDEVLNQLRRFRNSFLYEPYKVTSKMITAIKPQAPSCDRKADGLIDYVRELKDDQLSEEEKKLNRPWIDLIVFMVDCQ